MRIFADYADFILVSSAFFRANLRLVFLDAGLR